MQSYSTGTVFNSKIQHFEPMNVKSTINDRFSYLTSCCMKAAKYENKGSLPSLPVKKHGGFTMENSRREGKFVCYCNKESNQERLLVDYKCDYIDTFKEG